jgi:hypothetical protein
VLPPSLETHHCTLGVGFPEAAALNVTLVGLVTLALAG